MSTNRISPKAGWVVAKNLPKGPNGRALCRNCGTEVPKGRRTFCGDGCVDDWSARNNPAVMRLRVFKRDKGVCALCGTDTEALQRQIKKAAAADLNLFGAGYRARRAVLEPLGYPLHRQTLWDADHIVPVIEGGGECSLDNIRTLCLPCHRTVTAELAQRRAVRRRQEKLGHLGKANPQMRLPE